MTVYATTFLRVVPALIALFLAGRREFAWAAGFLALSVIADGVFVMVKKRSRDFDAGFQLHLEGLTDFLAYGVCPALFCTYAAPGPVVWAAAGVFLCSAIFRISRFNCEGLIEGCYRGLPITYNGYIFPALYFLARIARWEGYQGLIFCTALLLVSGLMVSSKLKVKELG